MRDRLILVGEDFGNSRPEYHDDMYALSGASGRRLADLAGLTFMEYALACERTNVVTVPVDWFDRVVVNQGVRRVINEMAGRRTILLGSRVRKAFSLENLDYYEWQYLAGGHVAVMPHPSGRSHHWNVPRNVAAAQTFFRSALRDHGAEAP